MSSVRSASSVGPNRMHTFTGVVTPTSEPAARRLRRASLITPRSAPSVRLKCVYHWYLVRLVRIACCGFGIAAPLLRRGSVFYTAQELSCMATRVLRVRSRTPARIAAGRMAVDLVGPVGTHGPDGPAPTEG